MTYIQYDLHSRQPNGRYIIDIMVEIDDIMIPLHCPRSDNLPECNWDLLADMLVDSHESTRVILDAIDKALPVAQQLLDDIDDGVIDPILVDGWTLHNHGYPY